MRTTLNLDDQAIERAMEQAPGKTKTAVINEALREYARRREQARFADLRGRYRWEGDLDRLRKRVPRRTQ